MRSIGMGHERRSDRIIRILILLCTVGACGSFIGQGLAQMAAAQLPGPTPVAADLSSNTLTASVDRPTRDPSAVLSSALFLPEVAEEGAPPESIARDEPESAPKHCDGVRVVGLISGDVQSAILSAAGSRSVTMSVGDTFEGRRLVQLSAAGVTLEDAEGRSCAVGMFAPREVAAPPRIPDPALILTVENRAMHRYPIRHRRVRTRS